jgi:hypothetical protein
MNMHNVEYAWNSIFRLFNFWYSTLSITSRGAFYDCAYPFKKYMLIFICERYGFRDVRYDFVLKNYLYLGILGMWGWGVYVGVCFYKRFVLSWAKLFIELGLILPQTYWFPMFEFWVFLFLHN